MIAILTPLMAVLGPLAVLLLMAVLFAETGLLVGAFLPGDSLLFAAGVLVAAGVMHLPLEVVGAGALVAAVAGDQTGYVLGRRFGPRVFNRRDSRLFSHRHVIRAQQFVDRYGPRAVLLARFVPLVRALTPVVAGVGRMPRGRFTFYNVIGAAVWTALMLAAGFLLGGVSVVADHIELIVVGVVALSLLPAVAASLHRRRSGRSRLQRGRDSGVLTARITQSPEGTNHD